MPLVGVVAAVVDAVAERGARDAGAVLAAPLAARARPAPRALQPLDAARQRR